MNMSTIGVLTLALSIAASSAQAMPMMGGQSSKAASPEERFAAMDTDHDGAVTGEEFSKALPNINKNAFTSIDADRNGSISLEEWKNFSSSHRGSVQTPDMERMMKAMKDGMTPPASAPSKDGVSTPLIMPPAQTVPAPADSSTSGSMPLVMPPAGK